VQGAVFKPGRVLLNDKRVAQQTYQQTQESGDNPVNRYLTAGLKGAGGIRPDADLSKISIIRNERVITLDVSGIFNGFPVKDIPLIAGDRLVIPSLGKMQTALIRPSQITPPGFQVFMSNLSLPISGNGQAAISKSSRSIPYGTRLLEAAMAANCMGGPGLIVLEKFYIAVKINKQIYHW
jgi:polysaccharide export outer membrane protein